MNGMVQLVSCGMLKEYCASYTATKYLSRPRSRVPTVDPSRCKSGTVCIGAVLSHPRSTKPYHYLAHIYLLSLLKFVFSSTCYHDKCLKTHMLARITFTRRFYC